MIQYSISGGYPADFPPQGVSDGSPLVRDASFEEVADTITMRVNNGDWRPGNYEVFKDGESIGTVVAEHDPEPEIA